MIVKRQQVGGEALMPIVIVILAVTATEVR
jgi:hypothetical protein